MTDKKLLRSRLQQVGERHKIPIGQGYFEPAHAGRIGYAYTQLACFENGRFEVLSQSFVEPARHVGLRGAVQEVAQVGVKCLMVKCPEKPLFYGIKLPIIVPVGGMYLGPFHREGVQEVGGDLGGRLPDLGLALLDLGERVQVSAATFFMFVHELVQIGAAVDLVAGGVEEGGVKQVPMLTLQRFVIFQAGTEQND